MTDLIDRFPDALLTRSELARLLKVSQRHTYTLEAEGCPRIDLGGAVRFDPAAVRAYLAERTRIVGAPIQAKTRSVRMLPEAEPASTSTSRSMPARVGLARQHRIDRLDALAPGLVNDARTRVARKGART